MESPEVKKLAEEDPQGLLNEYPNGCVIDEIQRAPELLSYIQVRIDGAKTNGMYVLT